MHPSIRKYLRGYARPEHNRPAIIVRLVAPCSPLNILRSVSTSIKHRGGDKSPHPACHARRATRRT